jgi:hypothetical protein
VLYQAADLVKVCSTTLLPQRISCACQAKIEEAMKLFHDDYQGREVNMLKKLNALEVKCGLVEAKLSVMKLPGAPAAGGPPPG